MIHKTHSKKNLIDLFNDLNYKINRNKTKKSIIDEIVNLIQKKAIQIKKINSYQLKNLDDLIYYLSTPNNKEKISIEEKKEVMIKCKKIIQYSKSDYNIKLTEYKNNQQIYNDVIFISPYGFIPSVRRACKLYNQDINKKNHINPIISDKIQKELDFKENIKKIKKEKFKIKYGEFSVIFD